MSVLNSASFQQDCVAKDPIQAYEAKVFRLVETQEFAATSTLVDDLDEQFMLEQMLDEVKPPYRENTEHMHYLLKTPFRYPPLRHGSRFGTRLMQSFFYASEQVTTTLAEVAYYRFVFLDDMQDTYSNPIRSEHLLFSVAIKSASCIDLAAHRFEPYKPLARDPQSYGFCQQIGKWLVETLNVDTIRYWSARCENGTNVAIFEPRSITSSQPEEQQNWLCLTHKEKISFTQFGGGQPINFQRQQFLVNRKIPRPA